MRPAWNDPDLRGGTRIRVALWLLDEVGEGNTFTKAQLRDAFPGVEQVDRRMRDLRTYGWVIATNREEAGLPPNTLRFAKAGAEVWNRSAAQQTAPALNNKERTAVMAADDFLCTACGIAGGETYPDSRSGAAAQLSVSSREVLLPDGTASRQYLTECKRCRAGGTEEAAPRLTDTLSEIDTLSAAEREELAQWIRRGRRQPRRVDQLWAEYRRLPAESREAIAGRLRTRP